MKTENDEPTSTKLPRPRTGEGWGEGTPSRQLQSITARARALRQASTDAERLLWSRLRNRQLAGLKFRRQRPIGPFYLDFYAEVPRLAVEVDGGQHYTLDGQARDAAR